MWVKLKHHLAVFGKTEPPIAAFVDTFCRSALFFIKSPELQTDSEIKGQWP